MTRSPEAVLYNAPSSYYSMIARFALIENGFSYRSIRLDIHARMEQQRPAYVRINPNMTVPAWVGPDATLTESRSIAEYAFNREIDEETRGWLDLHYNFPIEELTFGRLLQRRPFARSLILRRLEASRRRLERLAAETPDLAALYRKRADTFAARIVAFDPELIGALAERRLADARGLAGRLEAALSDGRATLVRSGFGVADVVWIVFLARMMFLRLDDEIEKRPNLSRYWRAAEARQGFRAADIWTRPNLLRMIAGILGL